MTDVAPPEPNRNFGFVRDGMTTPQLLSWEDGPDTVRKAVSEALNARNVAFLLGAGCSSLKVGGVEVGVPTMLPLASEFSEASSRSDEIGESEVPAWAIDADERALLDEFGISLDDPEYQRNLERLMEALHSLHFLLYRSTREPHEVAATVISKVISKVKAFIWERCTNGEFARGNDSVLGTYEQFYRKLILRDRSLPRPWVFTTNYDLFNERAMDRLGLPYTNGFTGVVERRFNPSLFRYALAEQLDLSNRKWAAVDGFVYLCKLHGSISWFEDDKGLFSFREQWPSEAGNRVMIYPTPAKQNSSLGSPYADLFREFQAKTVQEQSVLITVGYAFGDEHVNNIIYQALTVPTFRLIIFADPGGGGEIGKLRGLGDPRVWIVGGDGPTPDSRAHYFDNVVQHFLPLRSSDKIEAAVRKILESMSSASGIPKEEAGAAE